MDYTQLSEKDVKRMLAAIGVGQISDLLAPVPADHRLQGPLALPPPMSEPELLADLDRLAGKNAAPGPKNVCFLGAGAYEHFVPTLIDALVMRGEFVTAYTPYQAEASQGSLQAFYEYQSMVCQLTGMQVANASLYEGGSGLAEAVLMARNITGKHRVVVSQTVNPDYRKVLETYLTDLPMAAEIVPAAAGLTNEKTLAEAVDDATAAVVIQTPNFFGCVEPADRLIAAAHGAGALAIVVADPISMGLLKTPGQLGTDICVGEGQALGIPLQYGGPYLGFLACRNQHVRKMPGRLVGATRDQTGRRGYCLTLQTREQHIRREKATSNVCTNQGLLALRAGAYLAAMGRNGIRTVAQLCLNKAHYAARRIGAIDGYRLRFSAPFFKEFVVQTDHPVEAVLEHCRSRGILAGVALGRWFPHLHDCFMVAVTELRTVGEIDGLVDALASAPASR